MDHEQSAAITDAEQSAPDPEVVDGVVVIANVRALAGVREGPPPFVQVAAVAATGFMAGAATAAVFGRRLSRSQSRRSAAASSLDGRPARQLPGFEVVASQRFLVDVHTLARR
jgi:hypothetical protein